VEIEASALTTCARLEDGDVMCWGARGQTLVDNDVLGPISCPVATKVEPLSGAIDLREGCVARTDGTVRCGAVAEWRFDPPLALDARWLLSYRDDTCVLAKNGGVRCTRSPAIEAVKGADDVIDKDGLTCIVRGASLSCVRDGVEVVLADRVVRVVRGPIGVWVLLEDGTLVERYPCAAGARATVCGDPVAAPSDLVDIARHDDHACVVNGTGAVWCRDERRAGAVFTPVAGVTDAVRVAAGDMHACAVLRSGLVTCWGESHCGQAGGAPMANAGCRGSSVAAPAPIQWSR
jgi:hypothetical protein